MEIEAPFTSQLPSQLTACQIYNVLEEYFQTFDQLSNSTEEEPMNSNQNLIFEFLEHTVDTYPDIFFQKDNSKSNSASLIEFTIFKLSSLSCNPPSILIRKKINKIITYLLLMCKTRYYKIYRNLIGQLFSLFKDLLRCKRNKNIIYPFSFGNNANASEFHVTIQNYGKIVYSITSFCGILSNLLIKDHKLISLFIQDTWRVIKRLLKYGDIISVNICLKLKFTCICNGNYCSSQLLYKSAGSFVKNLYKLTDLSSSNMRERMYVCPVYIKFLLKIINIGLTISNDIPFSYIIVFTEYLSSKFNDLIYVNFDKLDIYAFQFVIVILKKASNLEEKELTSQLLDMFKKLKVNNLPVCILEELACLVGAKIKDPSNIYEELIAQDDTPSSVYRILFFLCAVKLVHQPSNFLININFALINSKIKFLVDNLCSEGNRLNAPYVFDCLKMISLSLSLFAELRFEDTNNMSYLMKLVCNHYDIEGNISLESTKKINEFDMHSLIFIIFKLPKCDSKRYDNLCLNYIIKYNVDFPEFITKYLLVLLRQYLTNQSIEFHMRIISTIFDILPKTSSSKNLINYINLSLESLSSISSNVSENYESRLFELVTHSQMLQSQTIQIIPSLVLNFKDEKYNLQILTNVIDIPLISESEETMHNILYCFKAFIQFPYCEQRLVNYFEVFFTNAFSNFKEFRLQHRLVSILCKISDFSLRNSAKIFQLCLSSIVKASFLFNHTVFTVLSKQVQNILNSLCISPDNLYHSHRDLINNIFSEHVFFISKCAYEDKEKIDQIFYAISTFHYLFGESKKTIYLSYILRHAVCYAVIKCSSKLIQILASVKGSNNKEMMLNNCKYIFPELFIKCKQDELLKSARFLESEMQVPLKTVLIAEFQEIIHQCFLNIGEHEFSIIKGIKMMISKEFSEFQINDIPNLSALFEDRILGILAFFNFTLISGDVYDKKKVINSIGKVIELAEKSRIDRFRLKTLALLRYATKIAKELNLVEMLLQAWFPFIENINEKNLASITPHIVSSVLPLISVDKERVFLIIHKLLVEKSSFTNVILGEIHLMNDSERFLVISNLFLQHTHKKTENKSLKTILLEFTEHVSSDFIDVRKGAILNLSDFIMYQQKDLSEMVNDNQGKEILSRLYNQLLFCCTDPQSECVIEAGRCLGILGSFDYSLFDQFEQNYSKSKKAILFPTVLEPVDPFCQALIIELSNAFLFACDTQQQDCAAFAIQEILVKYMCSPKHLSKSFDEYVRYSKFPQNIQEVIVSHINSRYKNKSQSSWSNLPCPLYGQPRASTHKDWIKLWSAFLISLIQDESLRASLLKPCLAIVRYDASISKFLLPYIIVYIFEDSDTLNQKIILDECNHLLNLILESTELSEGIIKCVEVVLDLFDFLASYVSLAKTKNILNYGNKKHALFRFLDSFCYSKLSRASFLCRSYARALRYLEIFLVNQIDKSTTQKLNLEYLQKIYCLLDDYDGISGVEKVLSNQLSLEARVVEMESQGRFRDVIAYYEKHLMDPEKILISHCGILRSMLQLGQFQSVHSYYGSISTVSDVSLHSSIVNAHMEALWRLGSWEELDALLANEKKNNASFDCSIALTTASLNSRNNENFLNELKSAYINESKKLTFFGSESYPLKRCSQVLSTLHSLFDIEMAGRIMGIPFNLSSLSDDIKTISNIVYDNMKKSRNISNDSCSMKNYFDLLENRLNQTEVSYNIREPLLNLHRIIKEIMSPVNTNIELTNYWASCANLARKCGYFETAFNYLLYAEKQSQLDLNFIKEKAKFLIAQRTKHEALAFLRKTFLNNPNITRKDSLIYSKVKLMSCRLMAETLDCDPSETMKAFNEAIALGKNLEKVHFVVGDYYEKLIKSSGDPTKTYEMFLSSVSNIILHYGTSLKFGYKYLYHTLPRLVTLWIDLPSNLDIKNIHPNNKSKVKDPTSAQHQIKVNEKIISVCSIITNFSKALPQFVFLCALPQLVSRICHQNDTIWEVLRGLLTKLLVTFPQQVSWQMVGVAHSSFPLRVSKCKSIFDAAQRLDSSLIIMLNHLMQLTERLLDISNKKDRGNILILSQSFPSLSTLINDKNFSKIIIPSMVTLNCVLPSSPGDKNHSLFVNPMPYITTIKEEIKVFSSLQRPKKIEIISSTGEVYSLLCKPKDDLRRDGRLMEFNSLVNKFLCKHPQARKRNLRVRLFAVVPLNDECGIIEWVNNTVSLRSIILSLYSQINAGIAIEEIKNLYNLTLREPNALYKLFTEKILPSFPSILHEYFFETFSDAPSWYTARQLFTRSAAVMSMVGYILGLGDRHGENILLINTTGELVHVDFNCLFNKGLSFEWPEKVPFRLTHNMIQTMGSLGYQSTFQSCSEITMDIMRSKKDSLLCVLTTFLHDPLVEWVKQVKRNSNLAEQGNEKALKMLQDVEHRLMGFCSQSSFMMPLSVKGQVHQLIQEATNLRNLSQMYFGWAAFH